LKSRGQVKSTRTLDKALKYLLKRGLIRRETALAYLDEKSVLNPPVIGLDLSLGRFNKGKFIPNKTSPMKLRVTLTGEPTKTKTFQNALDRVFKSTRWVYVPNIKIMFRES